jgi:hypothetical protein
VPASSAITEHCMNMDCLPAAVMPLPLLSREDIAHFKREGYIIKHGLLDPELLARCRARLWQGAPPRLRPDDAASWLGPLRPEEEGGSGSHGIPVDSRQGYIWKVRSAGGDEVMLDLLPRALMPIAEQLLGAGKVLPATGQDVGAMLGAPDDENFPAVLAAAASASDVGVEALCARYLHHLHTEQFPVKLQEGVNLHNMFVVGTRARGIYATLPRAADSPRPRPGPTPGGHNDAHPFQLGVEAYIDDVPPNGGGLQLWPQAHRRLFAHYQRQHSRLPIDVAEGGAWGVSPSKILDDVRRDTVPVDTYGPAGTVILWHHRGVHGAGPNFSERIRCAPQGRPQWCQQIDSSVCPHLTVARSQHS